MSDAIHPRRGPPLLGLRHAAAAAGEAIAAGARRGATRWSCCRPAAASRSATRCRRRSTGRTDVVVSPLISLMKDQVDGLRACGYPAAALHSGMDARRAARGRARHRRRTSYRLVFVAPERLLTPRFLDWLGALRRARLRHRRGALHQPLGARLPPRVPPARRAQGARPRRQRARLHRHRHRARARRHRRAARASTTRWCWSAPSTGRTSSTASCRASTRTQQVLEVLRRHAGEAAIVYCLSRKDTESLAGVAARRRASRAAHYHAGMDAGDAPRARRRRSPRSGSTSSSPPSPSAWASTAATCAASSTPACRSRSSTTSRRPAAPAATASRPSACCSTPPADVMRLERLMRAQRRARPSAPARTSTAASARSCCARCSASPRGSPAGTARCRSTSARPTRATNCGACDVCLGRGRGRRRRHRHGAEDPLLRGARRRALRRHAHRRRPGRRRHRAHPPVAATSSSAPTDCSATCRARRVTSDGAPAHRPAPARPHAPAIGRCCKLNEASWAGPARPARRAARAAARRRRSPKPRFDGDSWEGVDRDLFDHLRQLRRDARRRARRAALHHLRRRHPARAGAPPRPRSLDAFAAIRGVGQKKLDDLGPAFLAHIRQYCEANGLELGG